MLLDRPFSQDVIPPSPYALSYDQNRLYFLQKGIIYYAQIDSPTEFHILSSKPTGAFTVYGGKTYGVGHAQVVWYGDNGCVYVHAHDKTTMIFQNSQYSFANFIPTKTLGILCIVSYKTPYTERQFIGRITHNGQVERVHSGYYAYTGLTVSPDERYIAFSAYQSRHMSWDQSDIGVCDAITGGVVWQYAKPNVSAILPKYSPQGVLYFLSDVSGYWQFMRGDDISVPSVKGYFGDVQWFPEGNGWYDFDEKGRIVARIVRAGYQSLVCIDDQEVHPIHVEGVEFSNIVYCKSFWAYMVGFTDEYSTMAIMEPSFTNTRYLIPNTLLQKQFISQPERVSFKSSDSRTVYATYYAPINKSTSAYRPLLIHAHGGPTHLDSMKYNPTVQYWTARGFGFAEIHYRGSEGYGRNYRQALRGHMGLEDVDDIICGAKYIAHRFVHKRRQLFIRGGSAGGYLVLWALIRSGIFSGGTDYCGVADLLDLIHTTHRYEAYYADSLTGYAYPEYTRALYELSPISRVQEINAPLLMFQGSADTVVNKKQSDAVVAILQAHHKTVMYHVIEGEGHLLTKSLRYPEMLDIEWKFYKKIMGIHV